MSEYEPPLGPEDPENSQDDTDDSSPWERAVNKLPLDDSSKYDMELEETLLLRDLSPEAGQNITEYFRLIHELVDPETTVSLFSEKLQRIREILEFFADYQDDPDLFTYLQAHYSRLQQRRLQQMFAEEQEQRLGIAQEARIILLAHQAVERILTSIADLAKTDLSQEQMKEIVRLVQPYFFEFKKTNPELGENWTVEFWQNETLSTELETKIRQALADFGLL